MSKGALLFNVFGILYCSTTLSNKRQHDVEYLLLEDETLLVVSSIESLYVGSIRYITELVYVEDVFDVVKTLSRYPNIPNKLMELLENYDSLHS